MVGLITLTICTLKIFNHMDYLVVMDATTKEGGGVLEEGDIVVDIGANVGMFSRRAIEKGCSKLISFEPFSKTISCLIDNLPSDITNIHKIAVSNNNGRSNIF